MIVGLALGIAVSVRPSPGLLGMVAVIEPIGTLWINALRMVVIPLVVSVLLIGVASVADVRAVGRIGGVGMAVWLLLLAVSAGLGLTLVPFLFSGLVIDPQTSASLRDSAASLAESTTQNLERMPSYTQWFIDLVPTNPVRAAADGAMLPLVVFSIALGLALTRVVAESRDAVLRFFRGLADAMLVLVHWILALAPIGVFALSLGVAARMGVSAAGAIGYYIAVTGVSMVVLTAAMYGVVAVAGGIGIGAFSRAALPAQIVGFTSRSSLASLPAQVHAASGVLRLSPGVSGFVLPVAVSTFKPHAPLNWAGLALFTGLLYGIPLGPAEILTVVVSAALLSFAVPGIPSAGMLLIAPIFVGLGLPVEALGILIAVDAIPDMFKTVANVTGQFASGVLAGRVIGSDGGVAAPLEEQLESLHPADVART
jgi:proton glutamate symport protein